jgi:hypothetical protein
LLPAHDELTRSQRLFSGISIGVAFLLLGWLGCRIVWRLDLWQWWVPLLGRAEHAAHHECPHDVHYCITTAWCNRPLEAIRFFRRLEIAVTRLTGVTPRHDDRRYEARYGSPNRQVVGQRA